ncbi:MAG: hypothetical protein ACXVSE_18785 [Solirubrobacteraceae bacterium]
MRRPALVAATITLALCAVAPPPPAAADVGGTLCSLAGWLSGVAGKVCGVAQHAGGVIDAGKKLAGGHIGGAIGALTGGGATKTLARAAGLAAVATAVVAGAQYALEETGKLSSSAAAPNLRAPWFSASYWRVAAVSILLTLPFLFAAAIQAMLRSDISLLARSAFGYLPLGLLAVGIAAPLTALLLAGSDEMSAIMSSASGQGATAILGRSSLVGLVAGGTGSLFVAFFVALFTVAAAVTLWLELLIREAAVYVIVLMLPLFFAAMVWPARRIWAARAVELLVALILSKFAIVAVLGLGGAALGHTLIPGIGSFLAGTTLVLLAAFSPWAMLRLLPLHELAGAAVGGLRPHGAHQMGAADNRAREATDATEDAAPEDVARTLPARLLTMMRRDHADGDGSAQTAAVAAERAAAPEADGRDGEAPGTGHPAPPNADPGPDGARPVPMTDPEEDAFGSTTRGGPLHEVFRAMSLDAPVIQLDQPLRDGGEPEPPAPAEPEDEPA